jgi:hypothetical protein
MRKPCRLKMRSSIGKEYWWLVESSQYDLDCWRNIPFSAIERIIVPSDHDQSLSFWSQVKGGEDLRQDERVQQALRTMNFVLRQDQHCRQKHLMINTYVVEPISMRTGLLQWVQDTKTFADMIAVGKPRFVDPETLVHPRGIALLYSLTAGGDCWFSIIVKTLDVSQCYVQPKTGNGLRQEASRGKRSKRMVEDVLEAE